MGPVTEKQAVHRPAKELRTFLIAERDEVCAAWQEEVLRQPDVAAHHPDAAARADLAARLRHFYDCIVDHLEHPEVPVGGQVLADIVRRHYDAKYPPGAIARKHILLKRLVVRRLVSKFGAQHDLLSAMCSLYENEIDEARIRSAELYHEVDVAQHRQWEAEIRASETMRHVTNAVISAASTDQVPQILFSGLRDVFRYDLVMLGLLTSDGKQVECSCAQAGGSFTEVVDAGQTERFVIAAGVSRNHPVILADVQADPSAERYPILRKLGARSALVVPLSARGRVIGALLLGAAQKDMYSHKDQHALMGVAKDISLAIQNLLLLGMEKKRAAELEMINAVSKIVTEHLDAKGLLQAAAKAIHRTFAYYDVSFFLVDRAANAVVMTAQAGAFGELLDVGYRQPIGTGMVGWTAQRGETLIANDVSKEPRRIVAFAGEADCKSEMTVPIKVGDNVVGVINVESRRLSAFDERDRIALETIAQQIAKGMENARLYDQTRILKELSEDIVSAIPLSLIVLDRDLRVVSFNPASLSNLGLSEASLRGRRLHDLLADDAQSSAFFTNMYHAVQDGRLVSFTGLSVKLNSIGERVFNVWFSPTKAHTEGVGLLVLQDVTQENQVQEEMRRVRKQLQAMMVHLPIGITSQEMNGVYTHWSTGCERIFGYKAEEMVGKRTPLDLAKTPYDLKAQLEKCRREGYTESERLCVKRDGAEMWAHTVRVNLYDESGHQSGYASYILDVTLRRKAQEEVLREKQKLSEVVTALGAGLALVDLDGRITWANKTLHDWISGGGTVIGRKCFEIFHGRLARCEQCVSAAALTTGRMQKHSHTSTTPDGALRHFQHIVAPLHDHEGKTTQFLAMSLDVTEHVERVNQIEMLQQLSKQLQGVLELDRLFYLILTCVTAGQGLGFNRAVLMLANREQGALEGRMAVGPGSAEEAGRIWETIREERKTLDDFMEQYDQMTPAEHQALVAQALPMRFSLTETSEAPVACLVNKEAILVANAPADPRVGARSRSLIGADQFVAVPLVVRAEPIGVILADNRFSRHPITEALTGLLATFGGQAALCIANAWAYHRLEEKIQQLAEARDRNIRSERLAAIGSMAAHVAHEIRNPLVTIGGFARSILRSSESSTVCGQHARIIVDEVARLEKILANVMNFTKPSPPHRTEISIDEVLEKTCVLLGQELKAKNIELVKHLDLKPDKVWVDANQMKQVFINVIQNAIDSIESRGRIIITTAEEDNRVRIDVADSGGGMTAEVQESIFLPFFTTKPDGTGLGLAVCRKIVEDHGGEMQVQSSVGVGTTFTILLPRLGP